MRSLAWATMLALTSAACSSPPTTIEDIGPRADTGGPADSGVRPDSGVHPDAGAQPDAGFMDAASIDAGFIDAAPADSGPADAGPADAGPADSGPVDVGPTYNCGAFSTDPGWTVQVGFRAVTIATAAQGLNQPVALTFASGRFGDRLYVVNQGDNAVRAIEALTGTTAAFTIGAAWAATPSLLTSILWDRRADFDGNLYVGDQGANSDGDSRIYRITATGTAAVFASGPAPGLDDVFGLAFSPGGAYAPGLYVSGDTDGALPDWGRIDRNGVSTVFSEVAGNEGIAVDISGRFPGVMYAARPLGGGYAGDGTITAIHPDGTIGSTLAVNLGGVHAVVFAPGGAYGLDMYAARWDSGELIRIDPAGTVSVIASGLSLTNYDGNILAFSPDGNVLYVADRLANRVVCIEPVH